MMDYFLKIFHDTKEVIRSHKSKDQTIPWPKEKRTNNDLQNTRED
jgi:hypothetical protein